MQGDHVTGELVLSVGHEEPAGGSHVQIDFGKRSKNIYTLR